MDSPAPITDKKAQQWAMLTHVSALCMLLGIPFGNIIGPLLLWTFKRSVHPSVDDAGKEAINFQITYTIYMLISGLLCYVLIGFALLPIIVIVDIILTILAVSAADKGQAYRYPLTIRFLK